MLVDIITSYRYIPLAVGLFVGGTPALVAALYLVLTGKLSFGVLFLLSVATTLLWDSIWYVLGRIHFRKLRDAPWFRRQKRWVERFGLFMQKKRSLVLFSSRFIYGTSTVCAVISGLQHMRFSLFAFVSAASITVWVFFLYLTSAGVKKGTALLPTGNAATALIFFILMIGIAFGLRTLYRRFLPNV